MTQQHFETFDLTIENDIAHICLNRPDKCNSMIPSFWEDLPNVVQDIDNGARRGSLLFLPVAGLHRWHGLKRLR